MEDNINIIDYAEYFHDGTLYDICRLKNEIAFYMSSAEVDLPEKRKGLVLSKDRRIRGILHVKNIQNIHLTGGYELDNLFKLFNLGTILDFEISNNAIELGVLWENHPPKPRTDEFTTITVQAGHIWWENIPEK